MLKPEVCKTKTPGQLSVAVGGVQVTLAAHVPMALFTIKLEGQLVNNGVDVSFTLTLKVQDVALPEASVAVYFTLVVPSGNEAPLGKPAVCESVKEQLSLAVGAVHETTAEQFPASLFTTLSTGQADKTGN